MALAPAIERIEKALKESEDGKPDMLSTHAYSAASFTLHHYGRISGTYGQNRASSYHKEVNAFSKLRSDEERVRAFKKLLRKMKAVFKDITRARERSFYVDLKDDPNSHFKAVLQEDGDTYPPSSALEKTDEEVWRKLGTSEMIFSSQARIAVITRNLMQEIQGVQVLDYSIFTGNDQMAARGTTGDYTFTMISHSRAVALCFVPCIGWKHKYRAYRKDSKHNAFASNVFWKAPGL